MSLTGNRPGGMGSRAAESAVTLGKFRDPDPPCQPQASTVALVVPGPARWWEVKRVWGGVHLLP